MSSRLSLPLNRPFAQTDAKAASRMCVCVRCDQSGKIARADCDAFRKRNHLIWTIHFSAHLKKGTGNSLKANTILLIIYRCIGSFCFWDSVVLVTAMVVVVVVMTVVVVVVVIVATIFGVVVVVAVVVFPEFPAVAVTQQIWVVMIPSIKPTSKRVD